MENIHNEHTEPARTGMEVDEFDVPVDEIEQSAPGTDGIEVEEIDDIVITDTAQQAHNPEHDTE